MQNVSLNKIIIITSSPHFQVIVESSAEYMAETHTTKVIKGKKHYTY